MESPARQASSLPFLETDRSGNVFLSWVETASDNQAILYYSKLTDNQWSRPDTIASSSEWFVNWADYPSITAQNGEVTTAHVLKKIPGNTYSYNVNMYSRQADDLWNGPILPHFDNTATEHGFVSMVPWQNKTLAVWLDGRQSANRTDEQYFDLSKAMTLRSALISSDGSITQSQLIDESVCDCCNTALAVTPKGAVAAYRNRSNQEIRDIYISRYIAGKWTAPKAVHNDNWEIAACPVNGPAIAAHDSTVVVTWFTAANDDPQVKAAVSTDYGNSFSAPIGINDTTATGRVDVVIDNQSNAFVSWMEGADETSTLKVKQIKPDHSVSEAYNVTAMDGSRRSGFPQMELSGNTLYFAWTAIDSTTSVKTAELGLGIFEDLNRN